MLNPQTSGKMRRGVAGQSLVELALSLPFLITLLLALLEIGFLIRSHLTILYATREGARAEAAAGSTEPTYWPIVANSGTYLQQADGDTVMVNNVNAALQDERPNTLFLSTYKADNTYGDPCLHTAQSNDGNIWATTNGTTCTISNTNVITNYSNWPVYKHTTGNNTYYFQEVFQRLGTPDYGFSRQVMDGQYGTQPCPGIGAPGTGNPPYEGTCGSNLNNVPKNWYNIGATFIGNGAANPWYPGYRCGADPGNPSLSSASVGTTSYYNAEPSNIVPTQNNSSTSPATRDWVGVRIDYKHYWLTPWFPGSPLVLSDKSVYNLEPTAQSNILVTQCDNSPDNS